MKRVTGYASTSRAGFTESNEIMEHKGVIAWQNKMGEMIMKIISNGEPIHMDYILSKTFDKEIADNFSKSDLVKVLESSPKNRTPLTYVKILTELMVRFSEKETSIKHFLSRQELEDLGNCLELLLASERFETACYVRDEINKRNNK